MALDGAIQLAAGGEDPLQGPATAVMAEGQAFLPRVDAVSAALASGDAKGAIAGIDALEMTALNLEVSIAALRTAYQQGGGPEAVREALQLGRQWKQVDAQVARLVDEDGASGREIVLLVDLVAKMREALTGVPTDLAHARQLLEEADATLKELVRTRVTT